MYVPTLMCIFSLAKRIVFHIIGRGEHGKDLKFRDGNLENLIVLILLFSVKRKGQVIGWCKI